MHRWRAENADHSKRYQREWTQRRRQTVIDHYGGRCACCGEDTYEFLSIDHKDGGGERHRRELGAYGSNMVEWIIRSDFPPLFRILCHNCNQARGYYGVCPHERVLRAVVEG